MIPLPIIIWLKPKLKITRLESSPPRFQLIMKVRKCFESNRIPKKYFPYFIFSFESFFFIPSVDSFESVLQSIQYTGTATTPSPSALNFHMISPLLGQKWYGERSERSAWVCEREKESEREKKRDKLEREKKKRVYVKECAHVCVWEREIVRDREIEKCDELGKKIVIFCRHVYVLMRKIN